MNAMLHVMQIASADCLQNSDSNVCEGKIAILFSNLLRNI